MNVQIIKDYDVLVIGTGAAGYNAANRVKEIGKKRVCIISEGVTCGTSRNTGSDKQTYYKLGLGGSAPDSVRSMAQTLFDGGCVDGDNALAEAALSPRCFHNLCELGVEFPHNRYGEYVGYKTDHDPFARATGAGPLTSKQMTEALEKRASSLGVKVFDHMLAVEILKDGNSVCGLICLNLSDISYCIFACSELVLATGGPADIYENRVYPRSHQGSMGLAIMAGASLQNLTEWQYGLASVTPPWNVSGSYMQVLPRFVSIDKDGTEYEFLLDYFTEIGDALTSVFLKGYQWPFDVQKAKNGSSIVDLLVYRESVLRGRRVYLDFTKNPFGFENLPYESLSPEAQEYLRRAEICFGTPIERLSRLNTPAIELYVSKGVDIRCDYLEIALCAQHHNGGIAVDLWWKTSVDGLYAIGECAGTHGITRPGGSALNAGQVGALRAALHLSESSRTISKSFDELAKKAAEKHSSLAEHALTLPNNASRARKDAAHEMSACAAAIRNPKGMRAHYETVSAQIADFDRLFGVSSFEELPALYRLRNTLYTQKAVLFSMIDYSEKVKLSRGSALYTNESTPLIPAFEDLFSFSPDPDKSTGKKVQGIHCTEESLEAHYRSVRPIPEDNDFFESMWRTYRENKNIY